MQLDKQNPLHAANTSYSKPADDTPPIRNIGSTLAAATAGLLAAGTASAQGEPGSWDFDIATLYYAESDDRVMALEPVFSATRYFDEGESLNLKAVFDSLTGASPNGATPSENILVFTSPSGNGTYTSDPDESPLDDTFKDTRVALSGTWTAPIDRDWEYSAGLYGSGEYDYMSVGISGGLKRYLNQKNTTLNFGASLSFDSLDPVGGVPIGLSEMAHTSSPAFDADRDASRDGSSDDKTILDLLFGVTQVVNRQTIMQFNYALSWADGYLTDPYKLVSVIDANAGANFGGNFLDANGNPVHLYEQRPDSRLKHSLYWQTKYALDNGDVIDGSYRFMLDDWGINSHTFDFRYRWNQASYYLEPHLRYYMQSEADFYRRYIDSDEYNAGSPNLDELSADYRLGDLDAITVGMKFGLKLDQGHEFNTRVEYYLQSSSGDEGFGKLSDQELYPDTDALIVQFGYTF